MDGPQNTVNYSTNKRLESSGLNVYLLLCRIEIYTTNILAFGEHEMG